jgi:hypothetical protein
LQQEFLFCERPSDGMESASGISTFAAYGQSELYDLHRSQSQESLK